MKKLVKIVCIAFLSLVVGAIVASIVYSSRFVGIERMDDF